MLLAEVRVCERCLVDVKHAAEEEKLNSTVKAERHDTAEDDSLYFAKGAVTTTVTLNVLAHCI